MISWGELSPYVLSRSRVYILVDGIESKYSPLNTSDVSYDKDVSSPKGEGNIQVPFDYDLYLELKNYTTFTLKAGWEYYGSNEVIKEIVYGIFNEVSHDNKTISIPFVDYGVLLEQNAVLSFTKKKRSQIIREIITKSGLVPIIDFTGVKDDVLSYSTESSSGSATSVTGSGLKSCGQNDGLTPGSLKNGPFYTSTVENKCPICGKNTVVWVQGSNYNYCSKEDNPGAEGMYVCCKKLGGCDADWCICGRNHTSSYASLNVSSPPKETTGPTSLAGISGDTGSGSTTTDSKGTESTTTTSASSSDGKTYWDMLMELIDPIGHDLQVIQWLDRVYVNKVPSRDNAILRIDSRRNLIRDTVSVNEGSPYTTNTVVVNYGSKKAPKQFTAIDRRLRDKYGPSIEKFNQYNYSESEAKAFAYRKLGEAQRDSEFNIDCQVIGHPEWYIGRWSEFYIPKFGYNDNYYITRMSLSKSPDRNLVYDLSLAEYYPNLEQTETESSTFNQGTLDGVMKSAEKYSYCHSCQTMECMERTLCGDCWAMSDYLYKKLTMAGIKARIVQYRTSGSGRHRSVQVLQGGTWADVPYRNYKINNKFRNTTSKPGFFVYRG